MMVVIGWSMMMVTNNCNALIQSDVPDVLRGRVMGVYSLIFNGAIPIGALLAGAVAQCIGASPTTVISAAIVLAFALAAWVFLPDIRRQA